MAAKKGIVLGENGLGNSPMTELITKAVATAIKASLGTSLAASASASSSPETTSMMATIARRSELLVHAAYILTGVFSERTVAISILLLRALPNDSPVSEKILRIFRRIITECLPSEQLHKGFSIANVAKDAWKRLLIEDPELHNFLQNGTVHALTPPDSSAESGSGGGGEEGEEVAANATDPPVPASPSRQDIPKSLTLLKGWLETGFVGWVPEHTAILLWDQLALNGSRSEQCQALFPILCCVLLISMRKELLAAPAHESLLEALKRCGRSLKTKDVFKILAKTHF